MITLLDTTLRDGEQTSGVSFAMQEKMAIARLLLEDLHVDRIEIASATVSDGEFETVRNIARWANQQGYADNVEVLGFVDGTKSLEWVKKERFSELNLWEGDYIFLRLLEERESFFSLKLVYDKDKLVEAILDGEKMNQNK